MDAEDKPEPHFVSETGEAMVRAYRPLHMSFLVAVGFYYAYVTAAHLLDETGLALTALVTLAMVTGVAATAIYMLMRRIDMIRLEIELSFGLLHLLMFANVAGYQIVHYQEARLVYFPLLAMAFAVTTVSQFAAS